MAQQNKEETEITPSTIDLIQLSDYSDNYLEVSLTSNSIRFNLNDDGCFYIPIQDFSKFINQVQASVEFLKQNYNESTD